MKTGRPTSYKPEFVEKVSEYLAQEVDDRSLKVVRLPTMEGMALYLGVARSSLYEWAEQHPEFSDALEAITTEQKKRLLNEGLSGTYNSTIAKLVLSANHGLREGQDVTSGGETLTVLTKIPERDSQ